MPFHASGCCGNTEIARSKHAWASPNRSARNNSCPSATNASAAACVMRSKYQCYAARAMSAAVGADVEALCSKCGDVWHVVVAKVGAQIVKVQCKQCGGYHRYKSPHGAPKEVRQPSMFGPKPQRAPAADKAPVERFAKPAVAADLSKPSRTYRASEKYEVGERVDHPNFGQGVVEISEPGKITVF